MDSTPDQRPDEERTVDLTCLNAGSLVPSYLDGELSEGRAAPLRRHLLACPSCREVAKGETALKRWFSEGEEPPVEIPHGFAARVARRAFAGDPGRSYSLPEASFAAAPSFDRSSQLPFLLKLTAVAAGLLFVFALTIQNRSLPGGEQLDASERIAPWERESMIPFPAHLEDPLEMPSASPEIAPEEELPHPSGG
jgi:anti-sigma factor RsiW